tara:strand:+ start:284 stop:649 length:366 start_codon:yes stop_codon:yes gene_type:complete
MIPNFDYTSANHLDLRELLIESDRPGYTEGPLPQEYDVKFLEGIQSLDSEFSREIDIVVISVGERLRRIRDFRTKLNRAYIRFSELDLSRSKGLCENRDWHWAFREKELTGEDTFVLPSIK